MKKLIIIAGMFFFAQGVVSAGEFIPPERIISLGTTVTENLYMLGADDRLIANTVYCTRPPDAKKKIKIGTVTQVDVERIMSLKPDLVLAASLTKEKQIAKMKNMGLRVEVFPLIRNFDQFCASFIELGRWVGAEKRAQGIIRQLRKNVDQIREKVKGRNKPTVFVQLGAKPLFAATREYIINDMVTFAGGVNIAADAGNGLYSREKVFSQDPDYIMIITMGIVGEEEKKIWESYTSLSAAKHKRVFIIDSYKACSPTPETFIEMLDELRARFKAVE